MAGKGPTLADGKKHDCEVSGCRGPDGKSKWPVSPVHLKWLDVTQNERGARMVDNVDRKNVRSVALLALTDKDIANLETLREADGRTQNYAVLIRKLIDREAKTAFAARQQTLDFG